MTMMLSNRTQKKKKNKRTKNSKQNQRNSWQHNLTGTVKTKDIDAVEGKSVSLPCPITEPLDNVYMVLWFRDNAGIPLYR